MVQIKDMYCDCHNKKVTDAEVLDSGELEYYCSVTGEPLCFDDGYYYK